MYWLFRLHSILPRDFIEFGTNEKIIMSAFVRQEVEDIKEEHSE